jgi:hypothetical protein
MTILSSVFALVMYAACLLFLWLGIDSRTGAVSLGFGVLALVAGILHIFFLDLAFRSYRNGRNR